MSPVNLFNPLMIYANRLRFKNLFFLVTGLLILDLIIPDVIPMLDEIILGLLTVLLANIKKESGNHKQSNDTEGEIIEGEGFVDENDRDG